MKESNGTAEIGGVGRVIMAYILLFITTLLWGISFPITKSIITVTPTMLYMGFRFTIGGLFFVPLVFFSRSRNNINKTDILISLKAGLIYFISAITQTVGLNFTTPARSGFITGLNVILVPVFLGLFFGRKVGLRIKIAVVLATIGIYIISADKSSAVGPNPGDALTFITAICYAWYIIYIDMNTDLDINVFSLFQLLEVGGLSFLFSFIFEPSLLYLSNSPMLFTFPVFTAVLFMGVVVTSLTFIFQIFGQRYVGPSNSALIFALEPIFAAIFGIIFGMDTFTFGLVIGGGLTFIAVILSIGQEEKVTATRKNSEDGKDEKRGTPIYRTDPK